MKKRNHSLVSIIVIIVILILGLVFIDMLDDFISHMNGSSSENTSGIDTTKNTYSKTNYIRLLASQENEDLEPVIKAYAAKKGYYIDIDYAGTLDIMQKLNNGEEYDAVWASNSIWLYMLNKSVSTSASTHVSPVVFGITKTKAQELGFVGNDQIYMQDIVNAITDGKLKFTMSNPTSTNSGATAYLGMLQVLAGNPEVLKQENLDNDELKENLKSLFSGMERSSGSDSFLEEAFLKGEILTSPERGR